MIKYLPLYLFFDLEADFLKFCIQSLHICLVSIYYVTGISETLRYNTKQGETVLPSRRAYTLTAEIESNQITTEICKLKLQ